MRKKQDPWSGQQRINREFLYDRYNLNHRWYNITTASTAQCCIIAAWKEISVQFDLPFKDHPSWRVTWHSLGDVGIRRYLLPPGGPDQYNAIIFKRFHTCEWWIWQPVSETSISRLIFVWQLAILNHMIKTVSGEVLDLNIPGLVSSRWSYYPQINRCKVTSLQ